MFVVTPLLRDSRKIMGRLNRALILFIVINPWLVGLLSPPLPSVDFSVATDILLVVSHLCFLVSSAALISLLRTT